MLPEIEKSSVGDYVFLQDGARSHTAKKLIAYLDGHCTEYVKTEFWPPNSPKMNVLDFGIWSEVKARAWEKTRQISNVLKTPLQRNGKLTLK